jgi:hypothetical protein
MICLAIAGSLVAGIHYIVIERPAQIAALQAPENIDPDCDFDACWRESKACATECYAQQSWFVKHFRFGGECSYCSNIPECEKCKTYV